MADKGYETVDNQEFVTLSSGAKMPLVGLGTWKSKPGEVEHAVEAALRAGYRHIDCAAAYSNQDEVGEAFSNIFGEGVVKREDVFVTSKLWNSEHAADKVRPACEKTLKELGLKQLDLYLVHWPVTGNQGPTLQPPYQETWEAMEKLVDAGLVKSIGVSNLSVKKLGDVLKYARIPPAVNQVERHPYWTNQKLVNFAAKHNVHISAYSPLGTADSATMMKKEDAPRLLKDKTLNAIADRVGKSPAQVALKWSAQRDISVLPKSVNPDRIKANLHGIYGWTLSDEDIKALDTLPHQMRYLEGRPMCKPEGPYKSPEELWDGEI